MSILSGESIPEGTGRQEAHKRKKEEVPAQRMKKARITNPTQEGKKEKFNPMKYRLQQGLMRQKKQKEELAKKMANKEKMKKRQAGDFRPMWGPSSADDPNGNWDAASNSSVGSSIKANWGEAGSVESSLHSASALPPGFNYNIRYEDGETVLEDQPQLSSLAYTPGVAQPTGEVPPAHSSTQSKQLHPDESSPAGIRRLPTPAPAQTPVTSPVPTPVPTSVPVPAVVESTAEMAASPRTVQFRSASVICRTPTKVLYQSSESGSASPRSQSQVASPEGPSSQEQPAVSISPQHMDTGGVEVPEYSASVAQTGDGSDLSSARPNLFTSPPGTQLPDTFQNLQLNDPGVLIREGVCLFQNHGNMCFATTSLHCLLQLKSFCNVVKSNASKTDKVGEICQLILSAQQDPRNHLTDIIVKIGMQFGPQADAEEFLQFLLQKATEEAFDTTRRLSMTCTVCQKESVILEGLQVRS